MAGVLGLIVVEAYAKAPRTASQASPSTTAAMRTGLRRRSARENTAMAAVSQGLIDFANHHRQPPAPGIEVVRTSRFQVTLQPDLPIPGPNSITYVRCRAGEADGRSWRSPVSVVTTGSFRHGPPLTSGRKAGAVAMNRGAKWHMNRCAKW